MAIVLPANESDLQVMLRNGDLSWSAFLASVDHLSRPWDYQALQLPIQAHTNILFSSGTSGDPKAVPYSHLQPLRLAADTWAHLDVSAGDVFIWPTNLGWLVGPMLVYSCFLSGATAGIYHGSPLLRGFGEFVQPDNQPCFGELTLMPMLGESKCLLNADHNEIYYEGMPMHKGVKLRRHGDIFERTAGGFYKSHGRSDDTMNLGGIKTSAVEIERVCNKASEHIRETAAVAVPPSGGGPADQLVVFVVVADAAGPDSTPDHIRKALRKALQTYLNPYFKVSSVVVTAELPRMATNKVWRRVLRSQAMEAQKLRSKLEKQTLKTM